MLGNLKRDFFTAKARLNFEVYGRREKITSEAGEKKAPFGGSVNLYLFDLHASCTRSSVAMKNSRYEASLDTRAKIRET